MKKNVLQFGVLATSLLVATGVFIASSPTTAAADTSTLAGLKAAKWGSNVTMTYANSSFTFASNGIPNHARQAEYALPKAGVQVPSASTAYAAADPTKAQSYSFTILLQPTKASKTTSTSLGAIGLMISGAVLFNPYEGNGTTVATMNNFTVKNANGADIAFLDSCNGHPTPMGQYHYHALPTCITSVVDKAGGPSHLIGVAFDGFPIYGDRDMNGKKILVSQLDACNGITSATPEFPNGIYHYVLPDTTDSSSSIRCFSGTSSVKMNMPGMGGGMPPMGGMPK
jgi:hypothetical protein